MHITQRGRATFAPTDWRKRLITVVTSAHASFLQSHVPENHKNPARTWSYDVASLASQEISTFAQLFSTLLDVETNDETAVTKCERI